MNYNIMLIGFMGVGMAQNAGANVAGMINNLPGQTETPVQPTQTTDAKPARFCPNCGASASETAKFCTQCGNPL